MRARACRRQTLKAQRSTFRLFSARTCQRCALRSLRHRHRRRRRRRRRQPRAYARQSRRRRLQTDKNR